MRACLPSPTLSPTDPVPRGLLTLCPDTKGQSCVGGGCVIEGADIVCVLVRVG